MFSKEFLSEIKALAIQIANRQRGENHMQSFDVLLQKFAAERQELLEAAPHHREWDELPDITYYAACLQVVFESLGEVEKETRSDSVYTIRWHMSHTLTVLRGYAKIFNASVAQLEAATLAKYRLRVVQQKNPEQERAAIMAAIAI